MIKGKTTSGFEYQIDERVEKDWKFLKLVREVDKDSLAVFDLTERLLGEKQTDALVNMYTDEDGFSDTEKIFADVTEIVNTSLKN